MKTQDITLGKACKQGVISALVIFVCGLLCVGGCGPSTKQMSIKDYGEYVRTSVEAAKATGATLTMTAHMNGSPNFYAAQRFGFDSGIDATATFTVNPAATREGPP